MGIATILVENARYVLSTYRIQEKAEELLEVKLRTEEVKVILCGLEEEELISSEHRQMENRLPSTYWHINDREVLVSHIQNLGRHPFMKNNFCLQISRIQDIVNTQFVV